LKFKEIQTYNTQQATAAETTVAEKFGSPPKRKLGELAVSSRAKTSMKKDALDRVEAVPSEDNNAVHLRLNLSGGVSNCSA